MRTLEKHASKKKYLPELIKVAVGVKELALFAQAMKRSGSLVRGASSRGRALGRQIGAGPTQGPFIFLKGAGPFNRKMWQPKGGAYGADIRSINALMKGSGAPKLDRRYGPSPEVKKLRNLAAIRHEGAELAAGKRTPRASRFVSHHSPAPMLNDMNVAAGLEGRGSEHMRAIARHMRKPELDLLGRAIYPKANRLKLDPRRLLSPKQHREQQASFDEMQQLGLQGNRLSRHRIKKIGRLYEDAVKKGTFAARRAENPNLSEFSNSRIVLNDAVGALANARRQRRARKGIVTLDPSKASSALASINRRSELATLKRRAGSRSPSLIKPPSVGLNPPK